MEAFNREGITYWYDEAEIQWGDSLTQKVNEGLNMSRYVIVVLSAAFLNKKWPERELYAVLNSEAKTGEVKILPLIVGSTQEQQKIKNKYHLINDKYYLTWQNDPENVVLALQKRLGRKRAIRKEKRTTSLTTNVTNIPLPRLKKQFTQRERDMFLRDAFELIYNYFETALAQLQKQYPELETDIEKTSSSSFIATIYKRGDVCNRCRIWRGGPLDSDAIAYREGRRYLDNNNSFNDWLDVTDDGEKICFKLSGLSIWSGNLPKSDLLTPEQAAEYLWLRFIQYLHEV